MHRWTARLLLLVMLVPAAGPLALARMAAPAGMHCMRQPMQETAHPVEPGMRCHHGTAPATQPASPQATVSSGDCCGNHDCCRGLKTSEWARPASNQLSIISVLIGPAPRSQTSARVSADFLGPDSTRAPPCS